MGGGGGGGSNPIVDRYYGLRAGLQKTDLLTDEQRKEWIGKVDKLAINNPHWQGIFSFNARNAVSGGLSGIEKEFTDLAKDVAARQAYTKAQADALDGAVNSKLMQTQVASFLGATAAKKAL